MSTPQDSSVDPPRDDNFRRTSIGRAFKRIKTAFRPGRSSRQTSTEPTPSSSVVPVDSPPLGEGETTTTLQPPPIDPNITISPLNILEVDDEENPSNDIPIEPPTAAVYLRGSIQRERARSLFEKYGLDFEAYDWIPHAPPRSSSSARNGLLRIEKPIRMRIRYTCHRCERTFGATPKCSNCEHLRCKRCPRQPATRTKDETGGDHPVAPAAVATEPHHEEDSPRRKRKSSGKARQLTDNNLDIRRRSNSTETQPAFVQRIRHTCHKCETDFIQATAHICPNCGHLRCRKCHRTPAVPVPLSQFDEGDAADTEEALNPSKRPDRVYRKPRQRVRWKCESCSNLFEEGNKVCMQCQHKRCAGCIRIPAKHHRAPDPAPNPQVQSSVQARLEGLSPLRSPVPALQQPPAATSSSA